MVDLLKAAFALAIFISCAALFVGGFALLLWGAAL